MSENKKRSFFSRIFEDDEETKKEQPIQQGEISTTTFESSPITKPVSNSTPDEEMVNKLWQVIIEENLPGPDYVELRNNVAAISESGLTTDENQMFKAAYNVLKRSYPQLTKEIISNSIEKYKDIIEGEKKNGLEQFERLRKTKVESKNAEIETLKKRRETLEGEIRQKKEELGNIAVQLDKLEDEVQENTSTITRQIEKFESSVEKVLQVLDSDKNTINNLNV
jgi:hypothetical protein